MARTRWCEAQHTEINTLLNTYPSSPISATTALDNARPYARATL
jgi:hypothetical protein